MQKLLFCLFMSMGIPGCALKGGCSDAGCVESLSISFKTSDNRWDDGDYKLTLKAGDETTTCSWRHPEDLPAAGGSLELSCDPSSYPTPTFHQLGTCDEASTGDAASQGCEYTLEVREPGTPSTMQVKLERDDTSLVNRTLALTYEESQPNGPGCSPVCKNTAIVVDVP